MTKKMPIPLHMSINSNLLFILLFVISYFEDKNTNKNDAILYAKSSENGEWIQVGKLENVTQITFISEELYEIFRRYYS